MTTQRTREEQKAYRRARVAKGICVSCRNAVYRASPYCKEHIVYYRERAKAHYAKKREERIANGWFDQRYKKKATADATTFNGTV